MYVGSSVYTAGLLDVMKDFGVGQVAATLPLTVFVLGFGLGEDESLDIPIHISRFLRQRLTYGE